MKLKMNKFYLLCTAIKVMQEHGVSGMAKYVWDLDKAIQNDRLFFAEQIENIKRKYGTVNESCNEIQELLNSETSELPLLPREKLDKLDEYPFLPVQYGLMLELIDKTEAEKE